MNKDCKITYYGIDQIKYFSFGIWDIKREKVIFIDPKIPAHTPRDGIAIYNVIFHKIPLWNSKRLNSKIFEYPSREWVLSFFKRVYVYELVKKKGKTIMQFKLIEDFDIDEIIIKFPKKV